jgi:hypothetical protein
MDWSADRGAARTPGSIVPRARSLSTYRRPEGCLPCRLPCGGVLWDAVRRPVLVPAVPAVVSKRDPSRWRSMPGDAEGAAVQTQAARPILIRAVSARIIDQSPWGLRG